MPRQKRAQLRNFLRLQPSNCTLPEEKAGGQRDVDVVEVKLLLIGEVPDEHHLMV